MEKCNKIKQTCGTKNFASCIDYEGTVNNLSEYTNEECLSIEETTQDIYNQLEQLDLSDLGDSCLEYILEEDKILVKNVLKKYEEEICNLKQEIEDLKTTDICNKPITACGIDLKCLETLPCDTPINTLGELLQSMINKICEP